MKIINRTVTAMMLENCKQLLKGKLHRRKRLVKKLKMKAEYFLIQSLSCKCQGLGGDILEALIGPKSRMKI
jgi:hypothetical protein